MTIDQRGSRERDDEVPRLLETLETVPCVRKFRRTIGDEVQGVIDDAAAVAQVVRLATGHGQWHIGIGIGEVEHPLPESSAEARGEAFYAARRGVDAAKNAPSHLTIASEASTDHTVLAESALRLMVRVIEDIRTESRRYVDYRLLHPDATQNAIAAHFDVSQQAVSKALSQGSVEIISGGQELSVFHLLKADTHVV